MQNFAKTIRRLFGIGVVFVSFRNCHNFNSESQNKYFGGTCVLYLYGREPRFSRL